MTFESKLKEIDSLQASLGQHPLYSHVKTEHDLAIFMQSHVYAVWDFMSLLKSLQGHIAPVSLPWKPSQFSSQSVRFINEIVLAEESDQGPRGEYLSHFEMYLLAMKERGLDTDALTLFSHSPQSHLGQLEKPIQMFVEYHLKLILNGDFYGVLGAFFFGREQCIPRLFQPLMTYLKSLPEDSYTRYYFERHIELDGDSHGPLTEKLFYEIAQKDSEKNQVLDAALKSLELRKGLWDHILKKLRPVSSKEFTV